jgi:hypothetical protein
VVEAFGGHGIGRSMHMEPHVSHVGKKGDVALEMLDDGWTVVTADGSPSAQFEHTVVVTREGCVVTMLDAGGSRREGRARGRGGEGQRQPLSTAPSQSSSSPLHTSGDPAVTTAALQVICEPRPRTGTGVTPPTATTSPTPV